MCMCVCSHPHATAWLLRNFTRPHLMLKMDMDKTIVTEGRATVQRHTQHTCTHRQRGLGELLNPDVMKKGCQLLTFSSVNRCQSC